MVVLVFLAYLFYKCVVPLAMNYSLVNCGNYNKSLYFFVVKKEKQYYLQEANK